jgi:hypothetical protein
MFLEKMSTHSRPTVNCADGCCEPEMQVTKTPYVVVPQTKEISSVSIVIMVQVG